MAQDVTRKISNRRLERLIEAELTLTALENADVELWEKYDEAIKKYQEIWAAHYLRSDEGLLPISEMAKRSAKTYPIVK